MVVVDRRSAATAEAEENSDSSASSYEWVTDSEASDVEPPAQVLEASMAKTILAMIPFTKAYREAEDAMFELNDMKGMQAEVARTREIKEMLEQGLHEEALVELKNDTIMSFHDFNRTKHAMTLDGKWAFETQRQKVKRMEKEAKSNGLDVATTGGGSGTEGHIRKKLMIRRIFDEQRNWDMAHQTTEFGETINWSGTTNIGEGGDDSGKVDTKHKGCKWRGENDEGVDHMCNNAKLVHPWKTYKDEFGAEVPEQISFCHFHAKFCLDPRKAHGEHLVKIKEPNEFALCNECYVVQMKRPPPALAKFHIPGVTRSARISGLASSKSKDPAGDALNEETICDWKPNRHIIEERGLSCQNKVFRNPDDKSLCRQCGWHVVECCMKHKDADPAKKRIAIPNEHGLCVAHYVSRFGKPPTKMELPYPGMEKKEKEVEYVPTIEDQLKHFLRPKGVGPEMEMPPAEFFEMRPPKTWREKVKRNARKKAHELEIKTVGGMFASRIQRNVRMWQCQSLELKKKAESTALRRHYAATKIQAIARRYVMKEEVAEIKKNTMAAVNLVSRLIRGLLARKMVKRKKAAKVLQRGGLRAVAGALMYAVKSTLEVRHEHDHEEWGNVTLQRYAKGFVTRLRVKQKKEQVRREIISALLMQKIFRGRLGRRRFDHITRDKLWRDANATVIQSAMRRVSATMYVQHRRVTWNAAAVVIQRRGHMYAAIMMAKHQRDAVQKFWDWLAPTLPREAFINLLPRTFYGAQRYEVDQKEVFRMNMAERAMYFKELQAQAEFDANELARGSVGGESSIETTVPGEQFFRKYDPDNIGQVSRMDFGNALADMWEAAGCPLLSQEVKGLISRFDHHNDGWIDYFRFLRFASRHEKPCAIHGRLICADCVSYGKCVRHGLVICKKFKSSSSSPNVCKCGAYISAHEMIPEPNDDEEYDTGYISKEQMDNIFKKEKKPDLEKPARGGEGIQLKNVINMTRYDIEKERDMVVRANNNNRDNGGTGFTTAAYNANFDPMNNAASPAPPKNDGGGVTVKQMLQGVPKDQQLARMESMKSMKGSMKKLTLPVEEGDAAMPPRGRARADTMERTEIAQAPNSLLFKRQAHHDEVKFVNTLPNRDQHWHSIQKNQYQALGHLVPSQHAPMYTESVKMVHHENHLVSYANETFLKREQSMSELEQGFKITTPIPLITDGELRLTTKAVDLYLHIFNRIRDEKLKLIEDDVAFVNFCFNFIVFMERHWRKLCKDIRMGKINKNLPISKEVRESLESAMLPNPKRAKMFEEGLRRLGFHDRASGTKTTNKTVQDGDALNEKKFKRHVLDKIRENEVPNTAREHRIAMDIKLPGDYEEKSFKSSAITHKEKSGMRKTIVAAKSIALVAAERNLRQVQRDMSLEEALGEEDMILEDDMSLSMESYSDVSAGGGSIVSAKSGKSGRSDRTRESKASKGSKASQGSLSSQFNITDEMRKMTIRDYLTLSLDHDETSDSMNVKFPKRLIRRASEGDLRPMTQQNSWPSWRTKSQPVIMRWRKQKKKRSGCVWRLRRLTDSSST
jgi:hypothetical protein